MNEKCLLALEEALKALTKAAVILEAAAEERNGPNYCDLWAEDARLIEADLNVLIQRILKVDTITQEEQTTERG